MERMEEFNNDTDLKDTLEVEERKLTYRGSKDWFYCPFELMKNEIERLREGLSVATLDTLGVVVNTDSIELINRINWVNSLLDKEECPTRNIGELFYITRKENHAPIINPDGTLGLKEMTDKPADVAFDPVSGICIMNAWDKFTSLTSLALGQRAFNRARENRHGLHASLLSKDGLGYMLMGCAGAGKTTNSVMLIKQGFQLLSDDWSEVSIENGEVFASPVIPIISMSKLSFQDIQEKAGLLEEAKKNSFVSYGKMIMSILSVNSNWDVEAKIPVKKIIILDNENTINEINGMSLLNFHKATNPHIPFLNINAKEVPRSVDLHGKIKDLGIEAINEFQKFTSKFCVDLAESSNCSIEKFGNKSLPFEESVKIIKSKINRI